MLNINNLRQTSKPPPEKPPSGAGPTIHSDSTKTPTPPVTTTTKSSVRSDEIFASPHIQYTEEKVDLSG